MCISTVILVVAFCKHEVGKNYKFNRDFYSVSSLASQMWQPGLGINVGSHICGNLLCINVHNNYDFVVNYICVHDFVVN